AVSSSDPLVVSTFREPATQTGGGGPSDRTPHGGFGGGDHRNQEPNSPNYGDRLRRCRLGLSLGMISIIILFVALTSAYVLRRSSGADAAQNINDWRPVGLPPLLWINTLLLVVSSCTLEKARRNLLQRALFAPLEGIPGIKHEAHRSLPWLTITLILGNGFLIGQALAWMALQQRSVFVVSNPSSSFFYLLTGTHAIHLGVGILALLYAALTHLFSRRLELKCLVVDVTSWYWHFMGLLWIYILGLLYFAP
ncbi:MAG: cytochrome c oxidase subunit 3, partial [Acidobacteriales bacterium]|nr:cytochrome c oxidase subunit 3 [Terriglobales bacterium]